VLSKTKSIEFQELSEQAIEIKSVAPTQTCLILVANHAPFRDPRIAWQARSDSDLNYICVGLENNESSNLKITQIDLNVLEIVVKRNSGVIENQKDIIGSIPQVFNFYQKLNYCVNKYDDSYITHKFNIPQQRVAYFRGICRHVLESSATLIELARNASEIQTIIAADLDSLLAAVVLSKILGSQLIYDCHEIWPESLFEASRGEIEFWSNLEKLLLEYSDFNFIASPFAVDYMQKKYLKDFLPLPNCETLQVNNVLLKKPIFNNVRFLYQGVVSPTRGLLLLITSWHNTLENAQLFIRGPFSSEKFRDELRAAAADLLDTRIFFLEQVSESELVQSASEFDLGIIPYEPIGVNNIYSCPNKLSQYLAAGLPILSNDLPFIAHILKESNAGISVDFRNTNELVTLVNKFATRKFDLNQMGQSGFNYFQKEFNWEKQSAEFYRVLGKKTGGGANFTWRISRNGSREIASRTTLAEVWPVQTILKYKMDVRRIINLNAKPRHLSQLQRKFEYLMPRAIGLDQIKVKIFAESLPQNFDFTLHDESGWIRGRIEIKGNQSSHLDIAILGDIRIVTKVVVEFENDYEISEGNLELKFFSSGNVRNFSFGQRSLKRVAKFLPFGIYTGLKLLRHGALQGSKLDFKVEYN
jgi:glycosyltransferase involved in cell wall biosynthesis